MAEPPKVNNRYIQIFLGIIVAIMIFAVLKATKDVMIPLAFSVFFFLLLTPLVRKLDALHVPRLISITLVMVLLLCLFVAVGWFLIKTVDTLVGVVPFYANKITLLDTMLANRLAGVIPLPEGESFLSVLPVNWSSLAINSLTSISGKFLNFAKVAVLIFIFVLFLLLERQSFVPKMLAAVPRHKGMKLAVLFERISRQISKYLGLKSLLSVLTGLMFFFSAFIVGLDLPILWGVLAFIFNFVPTLGSIVVTVLVIFMALIQFAPDWSPLIMIAVLTISTQTVLGNIIDPRLQGGQLNLSPFFILVSLSLWSYIWGLPGMFLAVPITSVLQILCANVPSLKPIAILMSSGKSYQRESEKREAMERHLRKQGKRRGKGASVSGTMEEASAEEARKSGQQGDFIMPDSFDGDT